MVVGGKRLAILAHSLLLPRRNWFARKRSARLGLWLSLLPEEEGTRSLSLPRGRGAAPDTRLPLSLPTVNCPALTPR